MRIASPGSPYSMPASATRRDRRRSSTAAPAPGGILGFRVHSVPLPIGPPFNGRQRKGRTRPPALASFEGAPSHEKRSVLGAQSLMSRHSAVETGLSSVGTVGQGPCPWIDAPLLAKGATETAGRWRCFGWQSVLFLALCLAMNVKRRVATSIHGE